MYVFLIVNLKKRIESQTYHVISLKKEKEWIGFSLISLNKQLKTIFIDYLCIDKKFQKGGYGKMVLNELNSNKFFPSYQYSILECEDYLVKYYEKNQFHKIPREYPLENSRPLYMLYRKRNKESTKAEPLLYQKFIQYGLLFNGEIIILYELIEMLYEMIFECYRLFMSMLIMNYNSTHT
jgi:predicted GNAT family N-acyltransferase